MTAQLPQEVTQRLIDWNNGDEQALTDLMFLIYQDLRQVAFYHLGRERAEHTLQPTALVHEVYLRLIRQKGVRWQNRAHFLATASQIMRRILVDYARARGFAKRGGGAQRLPLDNATDIPHERAAELIALDDALNALAKLNERESKVVELRFFGGLSIEETAEALGVSPGTVMRDWTFAKAWLKRELAR